VQINVAADALPDTPAEAARALQVVVLAYETGLVQAGHQPGHA
jgi:hypothetical protein